MSENSNSENNEIGLEDGQDVVAILKKMQHQLDSMEGKINTLVQQSKLKTFKGDRFSTPRNEYDKNKHPKVRRYAGKKEEVSSEGKFYHGRPFGKKKDIGKSNLGRSKKPFNKTSK